MNNKITIITLLSVLGLSLASCDDKFDINKLHDDPLLLVYCFPTEGDSTVVAVYSTVPVDTKEDNPNFLAVKVVDANVVYKVNGREMPVKRITEEDMVNLSSDPNNPAKRLVGQYCAIGSQQAGDRIDVEVSAEGLPAVSASTYIPEKVEARIDTVIRNADTPDVDYMDRMNATFLDDGSNDDYYMVRINARHMAGVAVGRDSESTDNYEGREYGATFYEDYLNNKDAFPYWDFSQLKWLNHYVNIDIDSDPVFKHGTQLDEDFGFGSYDYDDMAYFFNDQLFNGQSYTLRLDIMKNVGYYGDYTGWGNWDEYAGEYFYTLQFYKLTKEYYRFIKSKNECASNDWTENGLMPASPTFTNVHGGFGAVAGSAVSAPTYWVEIKERDNILYTDENK